jgi:hypothetical protein
MPRHRDPLVSFDVPRDWESRTIVAYRAPRDGDEPAPNVVVTRDRLHDDEDLVGYAERQVEALEAEIDGFVLRGSGEVVVDGHPAIAIAFTSEAEGAPLAQRMTMVALPDRLVATFTMTAPSRDLAQLGPLFERILASARFREGP